MGYHWTVNAWHWLERRAGRLWQRFADDRASYWLDWLPAWVYRQRKAAERRHPWGGATPVLRMGGYMPETTSLPGDVPSTRAYIDGRLAEMQQQADEAR